MNHSLFSLSTAIASSFTYLDSDSHLLYSQYAFCSLLPDRVCKSAYKVRLLLKTVTRLHGHYETQVCQDKTA